MRSRSERKDGALWSENTPTEHPMKRRRIINWTEYSRALVQRGSVSLWLSAEVIAKWSSPDHGWRNGRPREYSDEAILCLLAIRAVFNLPLRALHGFVRDLFERLGVQLKVPHFTTIGRRAAALSKKLPKLSGRLPTDIVLDSSGLKIYGEGEWKVRQHGVGKRRTWRKLHIALDPHSQEILVGELTPANEADGPKGADLLSKVPKTVRRAFGDGGYDGRSFRKAAKQREIRPIVPPPRNARMSSKNTPEYPERDEAIAVITGLGGGEVGRKAWKALSGTHIRSLVETTFSRLKTLLGAALRSRTVETQCTEAHIKCLILNRFTKLGMPKGFWEGAA